MCGTMRWLIPLLTVSALGLSVRPALAGSDRIPIPVARRPMTLPDATLRLDDGPYWPLPSGLVEVSSRDAFDESTIDHNFGFGIGVTRNFELGAHVVKLRIHPDAGLSDASVYGMYRFVDGDFEMGVYAETTVPLERRPTVVGGVPLAFHIGDVMRIDTGAFVIHSFEGGPPDVDPRDDPDVGPGDDPDLIVPFQLPISVSRLTLGPEAALLLRDFEHDDFLVGFFIGYTMTSRAGTLGDIGGRFRVPSTEIGLDVLTVALELQLFFDF